MLRRWLIADLSTGNLAPFDEEMTFNFRGPLNLDNIAVYQPDAANATAWAQVSAWAAGQAPTNLVFMNNLGGEKSGEFSSESRMSLSGWICMN